MSGGLDSTVASILLRAQGHDLIGVFMHNWDSLDEQGQCSSHEDYKCVQTVCAKLSIPCRRVDFVKEYWNDVFAHYLEGLAGGLNLNPDILCNQRIKFSALLQCVARTLDVQKVATGHYARLQHVEDGSVRLLQAVDRSKDQTFFLSLVPQSSLQQALFPVGHMTKAAVREVARASGLTRIANKKESYGLCFVGKRKFPSFISEYIEEKRGNFVTLDGQVIGHHKGHHFYTPGQRAGLAGHSLPYYVVAKCPKTNSVTVVMGPAHPALYTHSFLATSPHWICESHDLPLRCLVRTNHQEQMARAELALTSRGQLEVTATSPLRAVTPGQFAVFYDGEACLGASQIIQPGPPLLQTHSMSTQQVSP